MSPQTFNSTPKPLAFHQLKPIIDQYGQPNFKPQLKQAIENLTLEQLPLQQALTQSSVALDDDLSVIMLGLKTSEETIQLKAGISFQGILAGCSCANDPTPTQTITEYGEFQFQMNRQTGLTTVQLLSE